MGGLSGKGLNAAIMEVFEMSALSCEEGRHGEGCATDV